MGENNFYSLGSSQMSSIIKKEYSDDQSERSRISTYQKCLFQKNIFRNNNLSLSDLDLKHKDKIYYFQPFSPKISIDPQQLYEFFYASSTNNGQKFGILIKSQYNDLVQISQSYPDKTVNQLEFLATIHGVRYCIDLGIQKLIVKGNSQLVTKMREFNLNNQLAAYKEAIQQYSQFFELINFLQIPKEFNNKAKELSRENKDFVKIVADQSKILDQSYSSYKINQDQFQFQPQKKQQDKLLSSLVNSFQQQSSKIYSLQNIIADQCAVQSKMPQIDNIISQYKEIFSEYDNLSIKAINLEQDKNYALLFGKVDSSNKVANFQINQDLNEIIVATFCFSNPNIAIQEISLLYGMRFLIENKINYLNCFTNDEAFCNLLDNESDKLKNSNIREQRCLFEMKQLFSRTKCKMIKSQDLFKVLQLAYQNKQSRFQIIDESILAQNRKVQQYQSKTLSTFSQIFDQVE
ncbi:unnamed protein product [Paramecium sonneborni]|uniref:RNase H type-1 domain-containing protein n=1 Tax=Paramecium sonneborni TaxID=65129 RepID=A0A8S1JYN4_9CILI|nr:unnamed protein product [Paramecium sonneborni]